MERKRNDQLIYIAGPLYTPGDRIYLEEIDKLCKKCGFRTYLPHRDGGLAPADGSSTLPYFESDKENMDNASVVLAVLNGTDVDSGTAWELGYASARNKILIGIYEDTRIDKPLSYFNLMITSSTKIFDNKDDIVSGLRKIASSKNILNNYPQYELDKNLILKQIIKLPLDIDKTTSLSFGYNSPVLCCIDAILSINRPYKNFVVPRVNLFKEKYPQIVNLSKLVILLNSMSAEEFGKGVLNYNDPNRILLLNSFVKFLLDEVIKSNPEELLVLRNWANKLSPTAFKSINIKGIGIATFQYFRMLLGVNTVKPDIHISKFVSNSLSKKVSDVYSIFLIENIASTLGVEATSLDHAIWKYYSQK